MEIISMMKNIITLVAGIIFGIGLILSGMTNPSKIIGFLDITGNWDPSLAFVMVGAILIGFFGFRQAEKTNTTLFNEPIHLPGKTHITKELIIGSFLFGAGWALAGFCPGPAIVALGAGYTEAIIFVVAMLLGMLIHDNLYEKLK
jgi:hypothetical protein